MFVGLADAGERHVGADIVLFPWSEVSADIDAQIPPPIPVSYTHLTLPTRRTV